MIAAFYFLYPGYLSLWRTYFLMVYSLRVFCLHSTTEHPRRSHLVAAYFIEYSGARDLMETELTVSLRRACMTRSSIEHLFALERHLLCPVRYTCWICEASQLRIHVISEWSEYLSRTPCLVCPHRPFHYSLGPTKRFDCLCCPTHHHLHATLQYPTTSWLSPRRCASHFVKEYLCCARRGRRAQLKNTI